VVPDRRKQHVAEAGEAIAVIVHGNIEFRESDEIICLMTMT
jgi:hypothetical protein